MSIVFASSEPATCSEEKQEMEWVADGWLDFYLWSYLWRYYLNMDMLLPTLYIENTKDG